MWNNLIIFDRKLTESMQTTEIKTHALNWYKLQKSITSYMNEFLNKYELVDFFLASFTFLGYDLGNQQE